MAMLLELSNSEREQLKLSTPESFALYTGGLQALADYELTSRPQAAELSSERFRECVQKYPQDLLPRFYLGVVRTYLDQMDQAEAIRCFREVQTTNVTYLRLAAKYNLALAFIFEYGHRSLGQARNLLGELREDGSVKPFPLLYYPVWIDWIWINVRETLWVSRFEGLNESRSAEFARWRKELEAFQNDFQEVCSPKGTVFGFEEGRAVWADFHNSLGLWCESASYGATDKSSRAAEAKKEYDRALAMKPGWPAAKANLARLYIDVFQNDDAAEPLLIDLINGVEQADYSHYLLGGIAARRQNDHAALEQYLLAPRIPEAWQKLGELHIKAGRPSEAKQALEQGLQLKDIRPRTLEKMQKLLASLS